MATLTHVKPGAWTIYGALWGKMIVQPFYNVQASGENLISKDEKVIVRLESPYCLQDYYIAGPDVNDDYFVSDACGMAIVPKRGSCC